MNVLDILNQIGYVDLTDHGKHYRTRPLYRASDNNTSLSVDKVTGKWYDFGGQVGGSLAHLVKLTMGFETEEQVQAFLRGRSISLPSYSKYDYALSEVKKFDKALLLRLSKNHSYWLQRGISESTVAFFQGGTTNNGRMTNRYVFPIFDEQQELIGFSGRALIDNPNYPKWKILGAKKNFIYPVYPFRQVADFQRQVILVESIGDMLALSEMGIVNVIVTFGLNISEKILTFLLKHDCQQVVIIFNNDLSLSGNQASLKHTKNLLHYFDESQISNIVPPYKDMNDFLLADRDAFANFCVKLKP